MRSITIGNDQPAILGKDIDRHFTMCCKEQPVAIQTIFWPFPVDPEILDRRFNFNDPDFTFDGQTDKIGASTAGERQLRQYGMTHFMQ
ncbi:hypothetical protein D3C71_1892280 [compost metagenome]